MPIYISSRESSPLMSFIVGLAAIAVTVGLIVFFLPVIVGIALALIALVAAFLGWGWVKRKFGLESQDERMFRETMEQAESMARSRYRGKDGGMQGAYVREEVLVASRNPVRRRMNDVEDIEGTPVRPDDAQKSSN